jgi:hypothetical protein
MRIRISKEFFYTETAMSVAAHKEDWFEPDMTRYRFAAICTCTNNDCLEQIIASGDGELCYKVDLDSHNQPSYDFEPKFLIQHAHPPPQLIPLLPDLPEEVALHLNRAFLLFWPDKAACIGAIRTSVEAALTSVGIKRFELLTKSGGGSKRIRRPLSLHKRIELLKTHHKDAADLLMAAKWIGNSGAHNSEVQTKDVFDAFDIVEEAFRVLFGSASDRIRKLAKEVNKKKGPTKR